MPRVSPGRNLQAAFGLRKLSTFHMRDASLIAEAASKLPTTLAPTSLKHVVMMIHWVVELRLGSGRRFSAGH